MRCCIRVNAGAMTVSQHSIRRCQLAQAKHEMHVKVLGSRGLFIKPASILVVSGRKKYRMWLAACREVADSVNGHCQWTHVACLELQ